MALIDEIRRQAATEARLLDRLDDRFARDLERVLRGLDRQIRRLLSSLKSSDGRLVATKGALGRALALREELRVALDTAGWATLSDQTEDLTELAETVLRGRAVAAQAARQTPVAVDTLLALQDLRTADLLNLGDDTAEAIWRAVLDGVVGNRSVDDLVDEIAEISEGVTRRQARTLHDTAVSSYTRQVRTLAIENPGPDDRFLYVGPLDTETRPFCAGLVNQIRTREEIDDLSNGQLLNTLLTAGGYNCRHLWQFVGDLTLEDLNA